MTTLLSLLASDNNSSEGIFNLNTTEFSRIGSEWKNCVSFCSGNMYTMTGRFKSTTTFIKSRKPNIKIVGSSYHHIQISAQEATKRWP